MIGRSPKRSNLSQTRSHLGKSADMMETEQIYCPYCGETLEVAIDCSVRRQEYIEDCQVCCQPMTLTVTVAARLEDGGHDVTVAARSGDD